MLRRYAATGQIDPVRCRDAIDALQDFPLRRYPHDVLLGRVWELRHNLTAYDAVYVALAEVLDARLLTRDRRIAVHCAGGYRSSIAASILQQHGITNLAEMAGGLAAWEAAKLPVVSEA